MSEVRGGESDESLEIGQLICKIADPYDLEIHPSIDTAPDLSSGSVLSPYISRAHDSDLDRLISTAREKSVMGVLVGGSSTGKTRACWEAIRRLPDRWRVWHPVSPTRTESLLTALRGGSIPPYMVVWLNEAQHYLDTSPAEVGEEISALIRDLIRSENRGPVLVLGTLWPEYWEKLTRQPQVGVPDSKAQSRALLESRRILVPERFEKRELQGLAADVVEDQRMREAIGRQDGRVTQYLAGAFELLGRYELAPTEAHAIITAAIDIRRFKQDIDEGFLRSAALGYLDDDSWNSLDHNWFGDGIKYATRKCLGVPGPLTRVRARPDEKTPVPASYRLSDYLEQVGKEKRALIFPPQEFWTSAAESALSPDEILDLAYEAQSRGRFQCAADLYLAAADRGHLDAFLYVADYRKASRDLPEAKRWLTEAADRGLAHAWIDLARMEADERNFERAGRLLEKAGRDEIALEYRAKLRYRSGDLRGYRALLEESVALGSVDAMNELAKFLEGTPDEKWRAKELRRQAAESPSAKTMKRLRRAVRDLRRSEKKIAVAADNLVKIASEEDASMTDIEKTIGSSRGSKDVSNLIILSRIALNKGLNDRAREHLTQALDMGSMNERGENIPLEMLAKIMRDSGQSKAAAMMLKYGLKIDGTISEPWTVSFKSLGDAP
jgi:tetratricopeptide (TPR) repeat protein